MISVDTITIDTVHVCELPVSREEMGFPKEGGRGNTVLLIASEMRPPTRAAYQQAGYIHEGVCISSCAEEVFEVLSQMHLRWCPWPDRAFTLAVLAHGQIGVLADRLVVSLRKAPTTDPGRESFQFSPQFWSRQGFRWKDTEQILEEHQQESEKHESDKEG